MATNTENICNLFASRSDAARAAEVGTAETVTKWKANNAIPHKRRLLLLKNSNKYGVDQTELFGLLLADYLDILRGSK